MRDELGTYAINDSVRCFVRRERAAAVVWLLVAGTLIPAASRFVPLPAPNTTTVTGIDAISIALTTSPATVALVDRTSDLPGGSTKAYGRSVRGTLRAVSRIEFEGAEIVAIEPRERAMFVTGTTGVLMARLNEHGGVTPIRVLDVGAMGGFNIGAPVDVTHVATDPARRGFGVALVVPADRAATPGRIVFFGVSTGEALGALNAGHAPDSAAFAADGRALVVVNEGEYVVRPDGAIVDPPGSITIVRLGGVASADDVRALDDHGVATFVIGDELIERAQREDPSGRRALRIHPHNQETPARDAEPEYAAIVGSTVFVSLQENNAIGAFDLDATRWTSVHGLGVIEQRIDASDRDGGPRIDRVVAAMPMPDQIAAFEIEGRAYLVTANEGDVRERVRAGASALADHATVHELATDGRISPRALATLDTSDAALGRLHVCSFTGDLTGDGLIDRPAMLGARSVSVWDATTMERLSDTGDAFERWMAREAPEHFNADTVDPYNADARSTRRGPEPEGVTIGRVRGRVYAFVTLERPGAVAVIDVTNPRSIAVVDLLISARWGDAAPEGLAFICASDSPTGAPLLVVAYEASGTVVVYEVVPPY